VVLCEHTNTERGYLPVFRKRLLGEVAKHVGFDDAELVPEELMRVDIASMDRDPLQVV